MLLNWEMIRLLPTRSTKHSISSDFNCLPRQMGTMKSIWNKDLYSDLETLRASYFPEYSFKQVEGEYLLVNKPKGCLSGMMPDKTVMIVNDEFPSIPVHSKCVLFSEVRLEGKENLRAMDELHWFQSRSPPRVDHWGLSGSLDYSG